MLRGSALLLFVLSTSALAQDATLSRLAPLRFLAGHWTSDTEEEYWSKPMGDSIVGTYRVVKDDKPTFYEFWIIELEEEKPVFKMKHFNANLQGWEHKDEYIRLPVTETGRNMITFSDGKITLHYERHGDKLDGTLTRMRNGKPAEDAFHLRLTR